MENKPALAALEAQFRCGPHYVSINNVTGKSPSKTHATHMAQQPAK